MDPLLRIASAGFVPMALAAFVHLGVPDLIGDKAMSVADVARLIGPVVREDALERTMRLLCGAGVLDVCGEDARSCTRYRLTAVGALLQTEGLPAQQPSLACCIEHWMGASELRAWSALPEYILGGGGGASAFVMANGGSVAAHVRGSRAYSEFVTCERAPAALLTYLAPKTSRVQSSRRS